MNNSLPRLIDGMIATLRREVIPHVDGDFARGQAFGLIYMLNSIRLRASWSNVFLLEQIRALEEASRELEAARDRGDAKICELIDWLAAHRDAAPASAVARADAIVARYVHRQLKWELSTSARPMFDEMSRGSEKSA